MYCDDDDDGVVFFFVRRHNEVGTSTVVLISTACTRLVASASFATDIFAYFLCRYAGQSVFGLYLVRRRGAYYREQGGGGRRITHRAVR